MPPTEPPVAAKPVAVPRPFMKKCAMEATAGVNMREVPMPPRMEKAMMKCQYSAHFSQLKRLIVLHWTLTRHTSTESDANYGRQQRNRSSDNDPSRSLRVEYRSNLYSAEEGQKHVEAEDPAHGRRGVG